MWELILLLPFGIFLLIGLAVFLLEVRNWKLRPQSQLPSDLPTCYFETRRKWLESKAISKINRCSGHSPLFEDHLALISKKSAIALKRGASLHKLHNLKPPAGLLSTQHLDTICSVNRPPVADLHVNKLSTKETQTAFVDLQFECLPEKIRTSLFYYGCR